MIYLQIIKIRLVSMLIKLGKISLILIFFSSFQSILTGLSYSLIKFYFRYFHPYR